VKVGFVLSEFSRIRRFWIFSWIFWRGRGGGPVFWRPAFLLYFFRLKKDLKHPYDQFRQSFVILSREKGFSIVEIDKLKVQS